MTHEQKTIRKRAKDTAKVIRSTKGMKKKERDAEADKVITNAEKDIQMIEVKKTGNNTPEDITCIICNRKINTGDYRILGLKDGIRIYRHEACAPGSAQWMKSNIGQASSHRKYFLSGMVRQTEEVEDV